MPENRIKHQPPAPAAGFRTVPDELPAVAVQDGCREDRVAGLESPEGGLPRSREIAGVPAVRAVMHLDVPPDEVRTPETHPVLRRPDRRERRVLLLLPGPRFQGQRAAEQRHPATWEALTAITEAEVASCPSSLIANEHKLPMREFQRYLSNINQRFKRVNRILIRKLAPH